MNLLIIIRITLFKCKRIKSIIVALLIEDTTNQTEITTNQIKCKFLVRGENRNTQGKTSQRRVQNQQTQPT